MQVSKTFIHYNNQSYLPRLPYSYLLERGKQEELKECKITKKRRIDESVCLQKRVEDQINKKQRFFEYKYESENESENESEDELEDKEEVEKEIEGEEIKEIEDDEEDEYVEDEEVEESEYDDEDDRYDPMDIDEPFDDRYDERDDYSLGYEDECYECLDM